MGNMRKSTTPRYRGRRQLRRTGVDAVGDVLVSPKLSTPTRARLGGGTRTQMPRAACLQACVLRPGGWCVPQTAERRRVTALQRALRARLLAGQQSHACRVRPGGQQWRRKSAHSAGLSVDPRRGGALREFRVTVSARSSQVTGVRSCMGPVPKIEASASLALTWTSQATLAPPVAAGWAARRGRP